MVYTKTQVYPKSSHKILQTSLPTYLLRARLHTARLLLEQHRHHIPNLHNLPHKLIQLLQPRTNRAILGLQRVELADAPLDRREPRCDARHIWE